jgi:hypothetical protein
MRKSLIIIICVSGLVACGQNVTSDSPTIEHRSLPKDPLTKTIPTSETETFTASISVTSQIKSNEDFIVEATLKNLSDNDITIQHAAHIFYFSIKNSDGKNINTFVMHDKGITRTIQGKERITERYSYKIEKLGRYEITAIAKFSTGKGENKKDYELETNKATFNVISLPSLSVPIGSCNDTSLRVFYKYLKCISISFSIQRAANVANFVPLSGEND